MSTYSVRIIGFSSALLATFLGGFLFVSAATVSFTIDGEAVSTLAVGETHSFVVQIINGENESTLGIGTYLEKINSPLLPNILNISCGSAENDFSGDFFDVECVWDEAFSGTESISFDASVSEEGSYVLNIETTNGGNDISFVELPLTAIAAVVPFTFDTAGTRDLDADGKIDALKLTFSSEVDMDTVATDDVSVVGYTVESVSAWEGESDSVKVVLTEGALADSDAEPDVTVSGVSGVGSGEVEATTRTASDESSPVMVSGFIAEGGGSIVVTFSEDIHGGFVGNGGDFSLSGGHEVSAADETSPGVVELTLATSTEATTIDIVLAAEGIDDLNSNGNALHTIIAAEEPDTTPIVINSVGLTTSATSTNEVMTGDTITLTFSLAEVASTTSISILDEDAIAPSVDGTTYTATYTVDADTATGSVTFAIAVEDAAGNETTASTTTDASSLTVVAAEEESGGGGSSTVVFSIDLATGRNLVSLPVEVANADIAEVLSGISASVSAVWAYIGSEWFVYRPGNAALSNLTEMQVGYAYFIDTTSAVTLSGEGQVWSGERTLSSGWSLVGYAQPDASTTDAVSIDTAFSSVGLAGIAYTDLVEYVSGAYVSAVEAGPGAGFFMNVASGPKTLGVPLQEN